MKPVDRNKVMIFEDDDILRESIAYIVSNSQRYLVVGSYSSCEHAIEEIRKNEPDIILMDIELPGMSGIEATRKIKEQFRQIDVIMLSVHEDHDQVINSLRAGASGYILKSSNYLELTSALDEVQRGGAPLSGKIAKVVVNNFHINPNSPLTKREKEVLTLMADGKTYMQISNELRISPETSKSHIRNIYEKLQVNKKSDAIRFANQNNWI